MRKFNADWLSSHLRFEHTCLHVSLRFVEPDSRLMSFERSKLGTDRVADHNRLLFFICFGVCLSRSFLETQFARHFVSRCRLYSTGQRQLVCFEVGGGSNDGIGPNCRDNRRVARNFSSVSERELG